MNKFSTHSILSAIKSKATISEKPTAVVFVMYKTTHTEKYGTIMHTKKREVMCSKHHFGPTNVALCNPEQCSSF